MIYVVMMLFIILKEIFCSIPFERLSKVHKALFVARRLDDADFKSPVAQKSIRDTSGDLAGISVRGMISKNFDFLFHFF